MDFLVECKLLGFGLNSYFESMKHKYGYWTRHWYLHRYVDTFKAVIMECNYICWCRGVRHLIGIYLIWSVGVPEKFEYNFY
jgi:hypothetical protein